MPVVAVVTIVLGALLALALVAAVAVILVQLLRTSQVLDDVDGLTFAVPGALAGLDATLSRITRALRSLAAREG
jgi:uncharacterized membrane protein YfbV (UPF0208 family)